MQELISQSSRSFSRLRPCGFLNNLSKVGWLSEQPRDFQARIATLGRWIILHPGTRHYLAGDLSEAIFGLDDGIFDISIPISETRECTFYRATRGFWAGDDAILTGATRKVSVEAVSRCRVFQVPYSVLRSHLARYPSDWAYFHELAATKSSMLAGILGEALSLSPRERVARLLVRLADEYGVVASTHEELGMLAGMSRATFHRSLTHLVKAGAVETTYAQIRIVNRQAVEEEAGFR